MTVCHLSLITWSLDMSSSKRRHHHAERGSMDHGCSCWTWWSVGSTMVFAWGSLLGARQVADRDNNRSETTRGRGTVADYRPCGWRVTCSLESPLSAVWRSSHVTIMPTGLIETQQPPLLCLCVSDVMWLCIYVCVRQCVKLRMFVYLSVCVRERLYVYSCVCLCVSVCVVMPLCIYSRVCARVCVCVFVSEYATIPVLYVYLCVGV